MHPSPRRERRRAGWDMRFGILMVFPLACLVVVLYEFLYLQQFTATDANVQDAAALQANVGNAPAATTAPRLRADDMPVFTPAPAPTTIMRGRRTMTLIANYRDSKRCAETLRSLFDNAVSPDLIRVSIFDQIYESENEIQCVDTFCQLVGEANCRRAQIVSSKIDAANATGPTRGRYMTEEAIGDEDFCMTIDSHLIFIPQWDEKLVSQWEMTENENAIITVYPKSTDHWFKKDAMDKVQLMCRARIETDDADAMVQYGTIEWLDRKDVPKPRLMSQLAGGFSFGNCKQAKEVRNDPYTPYVFHGEEYSRAARLWTSGYDFYVPIEDVVYHWYEKRKVVWERDWGKRWVIQQPSKRRIRYCLGLPVTAEDFDRTDIDKFMLGTKRTFEQWKEFSGIDPTAKAVGKGVDQFNNCRELKLVSYNTHSFSQQQIPSGNMCRLVLVLALALTMVSATLTPLLFLLHDSSDTLRDDPALPQRLAPVQLLHADAQQVESRVRLMVAAIHGAVTTTATSVSSDVTTMTCGDATSALFMTDTSLLDVERVLTALWFTPSIPRSANGRCGERAFRPPRVDLWLVAADATASRLSCANLPLANTVSMEQDHHVKLITLVPGPASIIAARDTVRVRDHGDTLVTGLTLRVPGEDAVCGHLRPQERLRLRVFTDPDRDGAIVVRPSIQSFLSPFIMGNPQQRALHVESDSEYIRLALRSLTYTAPSRGDSDAIHVQLWTLRDGADNDPQSVRLSVNITRPAMPANVLWNNDRISTSDVIEVDEDSALSLSSLSILLPSSCDANTTVINATIAASHGHLDDFLSLNENVVIRREFDSSAIQVSGTLTHVNRFVQRLVYKPLYNYNGPDSIVVSVMQNESMDLDPSTMIQPSSQLLYVLLRPVEDAISLDWTETGSNTTSVTISPSTRRRLPSLTIVDSEVDSTSSPFFAYQGYLRADVETSVSSGVGLRHDALDPMRVSREGQEFVRLTFEGRPHSLSDLLSNVEMVSSRSALSPSTRALVVVRISRINVVDNLPSTTAELELRATIERDSAYFVQKLLRQLQIDVDEDEATDIGSVFEWEETEAGSNDDLEDIVVSLATNHGKLASNATLGTSIPHGNITFRPLSVENLKTVLHQLVYIPDPDFAGDDALVLWIDDQTTTLWIRVQPINDPPLLSVADTPEDRSPRAFIPPIEVNDSDFNDRLMLVVSIDNNCSLELADVRDIVSSRLQIDGIDSESWTLGSPFTAKVLRLRGYSSSINRVFSQPSVVEIVPPEGTETEQTALLQICVSDEARQSNCSTRSVQLPSFASVIELDTQLPAFAFRRSVPVSGFVIANESAIPRESAVSMRLRADLGAFVTKKTGDDLPSCGRSFERRQDVAGAMQPVRELSGSWYCVQRLLLQTSYQPPSFAPLTSTTDDVSIEVWHATRRLVARSLTVQLLPPKPRYHFNISTDSSLQPMWQWVRRRPALLQQFVDIDITNTEAQGIAVDDVDPPADERLLALNVSCGTTCVLTYSLTIGSAVPGVDYSFAPRQPSHQLSFFGTRLSLVQLLSTIAIEAANKSAVAGEGYIDLELAETDDSVYKTAVAKDHIDFEFQSVEPPLEWQVVQDVYESVVGSDAAWIDGVSLASNGYDRLRRVRVEIECDAADAVFVTINHPAVRLVDRLCGLAADRKAIEIVDSLTTLNKILTSIQVHRRQTRRSMRDGDAVTIRFVAGDDTIDGSAIPTTEVQVYSRSALGGSAPLAQRVAAASNSTLAVDEDASIPLGELFAFNESDVDDFNLYHLSAAVSHGVLVLPLDDVCCIHLLTPSSSSNLVIEGTLRSLRDSLAAVHYTPAAEWSGTDSLRLSIDDSYSDSTGWSHCIAIHVRPVNDAPRIEVRQSQARVLGDTNATFHETEVAIRLTDVDLASVVAQREENTVESDPSVVRVRLQVPSSTGFIVMPRWKSLSDSVKNPSLDVAESIGKEQSGDLHIRSIAFDAPIETANALLLSVLYMSNANDSLASASIEDQDADEVEETLLVHVNDLAHGLSGWEAAEATETIHIHASAKEALNAPVVLALPPHHASLDSNQRKLTISGLTVTTASEVAEDETDLDQLNGDDEVRVTGSAAFRVVPEIQRVRLVGPIQLQILSVVMTTSGGVDAASVAGTFDLQVTQPGTNQIKTVTVHAQAVAMRIDEIMGNAGTGRGLGESMEASLTSILPTSGNAPIQIVKTVTATSVTWNIYTALVPGATALPTPQTGAMGFTGGAVTVSTMSATTAASLGGAFTLAVGPESTRSLRGSASTLEIQDALEALSSIDVVQVADVAPYTWDITFFQPGANVPLLQADTSKLTPIATISDAAWPTLTASGAQVEITRVVEGVGQGAVFQVDVGGTHVSPSYLVSVSRSVQMLSGGSFALSFVVVATGAVVGTTDTIAFDAVAMVSDEAVLTQQGGRSGSSIESKLQSAIARLPLYHWSIATRIVVSRVVTLSPLSYTWTITFVDAPSDFPSLVAAPSVAQPSQARLTVDVSPLTSSNAIGGTFTLSYLGQSTLPLPVSATAANVEDQLNLVEAVRNVSVAFGRVIVRRKEIRSVGGASFAVLFVEQMSAPWNAPSLLVADGGALTGLGAFAQVTPSQDSLWEDGMWTFPGFSSLVSRVSAPAWMCGVQGTFKPSHFQLQGAAPDVRPWLQQFTYTLPSDWCCGFVSIVVRAEREAAPSDHFLIRTDEQTLAFHAPGVVVDAVDDRGFTDDRIVIRGLQEDVGFARLAIPSMARSLLWVDVHVQVLHGSIALKSRANASPSAELWLNGTAEAVNRSLAQLQYTSTRSSQHAMDMLSIQVMTSADQALITQSDYLLWVKEPPFEPAIAVAGDSADVGLLATDDAPLAVSGITIVDANAVAGVSSTPPSPNVLLDLRVKAALGRVFLTRADGLLDASTTGDAKALTLRGTVRTLNDALASLQYESSREFDHTRDTITIDVNYRPEERLQLSASRSLTVEIRHAIHIPRVRIGSSDAITFAAKEDNGYQFLNLTISSPDTLRTTMRPSNLARTAVVELRRTDLQAPAVTTLKSSSVDDDPRHRWLFDLPGLTPPSSRSFAAFPTSNGVRFFFTGTDPTHGEELWTSDGSSNGTELLVDLAPGSASASPSDFAVLPPANNRLVFAAAGIDRSWTLSSGRQCNRERPSSIAIDLLYVVAASATWNPSASYDCPSRGWRWATTDEATARFRDTTPSANLSEPYVFWDACDWNGYVFGGVTRKHFRFADSGVTGALKHAGRRDSAPVEVSFSTSDFAGIVCIRSDSTEDSAGRELWVSDGSVGVASTKRLEDIEAGPRGSNPKFLTPFQSRWILFQATTAALGAELYKTDGMTSGTVLVEDIWRGPRSSSPSDFAEWTGGDGRLYFAATSDAGRELWSTDGLSSITVERSRRTASGSVLVGTTIVRDICASPTASASSNPEFLTPLGSIGVFFAATDCIHGRELWVTDGTLVGTKMVKDINVATGQGSDPSHLVVFNGKLYFAATADAVAMGRELFVSDGTTAGTQLLVELVPGGASAAPTLLTVANARLCFHALDAHGIGSLYVSDGTAGGTSTVWDSSFAQSHLLTSATTRPVASSTGLNDKLWVVNNAVFYYTQRRIMSSVSVNDSGDDTFQLGITVDHGAISIPPERATPATSQTINGTRWRLDDVLQRVLYHPPLNWNVLQSPEDHVVGWTFRVASLTAPSLSAETTSADLIVRPQLDPPVILVPDDVEDATQSEVDHLSRLRLSCLPITVLEDVVTPLQGFSVRGVDDPDGVVTWTLELSVTRGRLEFAPEAAGCIRRILLGQIRQTKHVRLTSARVACLSRLLNTMAYTSDPNMSGADTLAIRVTASVGTVSADDVALVPIVITEVNDAPFVTSASGFYYEADEDAALVIRDLRVIDPDAALAELVRVDMRVRFGSIALVSVDTNVVVELNKSASWVPASSTRLVLSGALSDVNAALSSVAYTSARNWNSLAHADENDGFDIVSFELSDDQAFNASTRASLFVFVRPTPDAVVITRPRMRATSVYAPLGDDGVLHGDEDAWLETTGLAFTSVDDTTHASLDVTIRVQHGQLAMDDAALRSSSVTMSDSSVDGSLWRLRGRFALVNRSVEALRYLPNTDFYGDDVLEIRATAMDDYAVQESIATTLSVPLCVHAVNDAPEWIFPTSKVKWKQDGSTRIRGVALQDVDATSVDCTSVECTWDVVIQVTGSGLLTLPRLQNVQVFTTAAAASVATQYVELTGSLADLNHALSDIVVTTTDSVRSIQEPVEVWFVADDQGLFGSGGPQVTRQRLVVMPIEWTRHALQLTAPQDHVLTTNEDTELVFNGSIRLQDEDASTRSTAQSPLYELTIESSHGHFRLAPSSFSAARLLVLPSADSVLKFRGFLPQINAALDGSAYVPDHDYFGSEELHITAHEVRDDNPDDADTATATVFVDVAPVCDAPRWHDDPKGSKTNQADLVLDEDTQVLVTSLAIVDPDVLEYEDEDGVRFHRDVSIAIDVLDHGGIMLATTRGLRITEEKPSDDWPPLFASTRLLFFSHVVLTGRVGDLNAALDGLIYHPQPDFHTNGHVRDAITLRVFASDGTCTGNATVTLRTEIAAVNDVPRIDSSRFRQVVTREEALSKTEEPTQEAVASQDQVLDPIALVDVDMLTTEDMEPNVRLRVSCHMCTVRPSLSMETLQQTYGVVASYEGNDQGAWGITTMYYGSITALNAVVLSSLVFSTSPQTSATAVVLLEVSDLGFAGRGGPLETAFAMTVRVLGVNTGPQILVPPYGTQAPPLLVDEDQSILLEGAPPLPSVSPPSKFDETPTWQLLLVDPLASDSLFRLHSLLDVASVDGRAAMASYALLSPSQLVLSAFDAATGVELWTSDGTTSGTERLKDLWPGSPSSYPRFLTRFSLDNRVFFAATALNADDWRLDPNHRDACDGFRESAFAPGVFFAVAQTTTWDVEETIDCPVGYAWMTTAEATAVFVGTVALDGRADEPFVYYDQCGWDGFAWGGQRRTHFRFADSKTTGAFKDAGHRDSYRPDVGFQTQDFAGIVCRCLVPAEEPQIHEHLWATDGTSDGTHRVTTAAFEPKYLTEYRSQLFFQATTHAHGAELWASDGTASGTRLIADMTDGPHSSAPEELTVANGKLFFSAITDPYGRELWVTDGDARDDFAQVDHSATATQLVLDIRSGAESSDPQFLTALPVAGVLLFQADDGVHGVELWTTDGSASGTSMVLDIYAGSGSSDPHFLTHFSDRVFFQADDGVHGAELWVTDGTSAGTQMLLDLMIGARGSAPRYLSVLSLPNAPATVVFAAATDRDPNVVEFWTSDGSSGATRKLFDASSEPTQLNTAAMDALHDGRTRLLPLASGFVVLGRRLERAKRSSTAVEDLRVVSRSLTLVDGNDQETGNYTVTLETGHGRLSLTNAHTCGMTDAPALYTHQQRVTLYGLLPQLNCLVAQVVYEATTRPSTADKDGWDDAIVVTLTDTAGIDTDGRAYAATQRVAVRIASLNHAPILELPSRAFAPLDAWTTLPRIGVRDDDAGDDARLLLRIATQRGRARLVDTDDTTPIRLSAVDPRGATVLEVAGSVTALQAVLATVEYVCQQTDGCADGDVDVLAVTVDDNGFSGRGGARTATETMRVVVVQTPT